MDLQDIAPQLGLRYDQFKFNTFSEEAQKEMSRDSYQTYQNRRTIDDINVVVIKTTKDKFRRNRKLYPFEQADFYLENSSKKDSSEDDGPEWDDVYIPDEFDANLRINPITYKREQFLKKYSISKFSCLMDFC